MTTPLEGVEGSGSHPGYSLPPGKTSTHCTGGWVDPRAVLDVRKISPPPGFNPQTIQPVASRYTDYSLCHKPCTKIWIPNPVI